MIRRELGSLNGSVLDLPCGTGIFSTLFEDWRYTGVDLDERYLAHAQRKFPSKRFLRMDALALQFPDASFDAVLVVGFLHHLTEQEVQQALREMHRVLKREGTCLLIEDCPVRSRWNIFGRFLQSLDVGGRIRSTAYYAAALEQEGFRIVRSYPVRAGLWDYSVFVLRRR